VALADHFTKQFGTNTMREHTLNWDQLRPREHDFRDLNRASSDEEIQIVVMHSASEKAPGPDGYIGAFYKVCWDIIKSDVIVAIKENFKLQSGCWNLLNSAHIMLIEKNEGAQSARDYMPINMMHSIAKLLAKILANRLAPYLDKLVSHSQSAFIKGRSIYDNFQYVKGAVNHFHQAKTPMLLLKLDLAKTFDSVQ
jgi:hypothetical protein